MSEKLAVYKTGNVLILNSHQQRNGTYSPHPTYQVKRQKPKLQITCESVAKVSKSEP